ncbi:hypothetical protein PF004_g12948 [Phytophthora fragariae]|uniref:Uncharacterized protein n=1 Tax=Phytophthora fragariae TaxID=53985 RepID=A0A6G0NTK2_9STRA|nr:hypothetical protein PF004_g12948 [Phytophthora fragariae]
METAGSTRTALVIGGSYAMIGARRLGGEIDYIKLRGVLEQHAETQFRGFIQIHLLLVLRLCKRPSATLTAEHHKLTLALPDRPQFQVSLFPMKKYNCYCENCGEAHASNRLNQRGRNGRGRSRSRSRDRGNKRKRNENNERGRGDVSSDEETTIPAVTAQERDAGMDEINSRPQVIDLTSDTESE